jgi:hypothetical protein
VNVRANPFKPTAGSPPPLLVGRQPDIEDIADALREGPGSPGRLTIFTGARGVGKTVMLNEVEDVSLREGWLHISETALPGLAARLDGHVEHLAEQRRPRRKRRVTGLTFPANLGGITTQPTPELAVDLRRRLNAFLDDLEQNRSGLVVTIDEVHATAREDLKTIAALTQHLIREERQFALVMAGLPSAVSGLLSDDVLTFLRRADKKVLKDVPVDEVHDAIVETITANDRTIDTDASQLAAEATGGYPFLIQLIGYQLWRSTSHPHIAVPDAEQAVSAARRRLGSLVHETALNDLSDVDKTFLMAMSHDNGPSKMSDIIKRMGVVPQYANTYRMRLLEAGMIGMSARGRVDYALPYLRDFLREHGASLGLSDHLPNNRA